MRSITSAPTFRSIAARPQKYSVWDLWGLIRQRRALAELDAHLLADLGLTETEAQREAARPVWDVPSHWLK
ncbi:MAG: DUF1127 domain-containing protein [Mangrovicoccus sp.]